MNDTPTRIIVSNVALTEIDQAIRLATVEYEKRFGQPATNVSLPRKQWPADGRITLDGRTLTINPYPASPGTVQAGE